MVDQTPPRTVAFFCQGAVPQTNTIKRKGIKLVWCPLDSFCFLWCSFLTDQIFALPIVSARPQKIHRPSGEAEAVAEHPLAGDFRLPGSQDSASAREPSDNV